jgi:hypothetical protein
MKGVRMNKVIDFNKSVYQLYSEYPEILDVLFELGFTDIVKPGMLNTAGRFMTIPKGASMKKISMDSIKKSMIEKGFTIQE